MSQKSWKMKRSAQLWTDMRPAQAADILHTTYGEGATEECLLRAFLAERDGARPTAQFWLRVFRCMAPRDESVN